MSVESAADRLYLLRAADFGIAAGVVISGVSTDGIVDDMDDPALMGSVVGQTKKIKTVLIVTAALNGLTIGGALTVGGVSYTANDIQAEPPDGLFTRIWLHRG